MTKKKKRFIILAFIVLAAVIYVSISLYLSANALTTSIFNYDSAKLSEPVTITALTDIHSHLFGDANKRLISKVEKEKPDLILIVGDGINWYDESYEPLLTFISRVSQIAPVYFTVGNHETEYMYNHSDADEFIDDVRTAGAAVVIGNYVDITCKGQDFRIGGFYGNAYNTDLTSTESYLESDNYKFLKDFVDTDAFKLMLAHEPQSFITEEDTTKWDIDLVVSGHEHGGQIRLPFIGAVYSYHPFMGWFPKYTDGTHIINGIPVIISRGLGTYTKGVTEGGRFFPMIPRFNNIPEICDIQIS